jgi:hypothetical protein
VPDVAAVTQGQSVAIDARGNDSDPDGQALTIVSVTVPTSGTATIDAATGNIIYTADPTFVGLATFSYTVSDGSLTASALVTVSVAPSNLPPVCTAVATPREIWPPNHKPVYITLSGIVDPEGLPLTVMFTSILQDEPTLSPGQGNTKQDGGIEANGKKAWVRAERSGTKKVPGDGRVYIIGYTATDAGGLSCAGAVQVGVPHDQRGAPAVLSPGRWNSITGAVVVPPPGDDDDDDDGDDDHDEDSCTDASHHHRRNRRR